MCVLGDVGQRLGSHEVGRELDRLGEPLGGLEQDLGRDRRARRKGVQGGREAVLEDGGVDAPRQLA